MAKASMGMIESTALTRIEKMIQGGRSGRAFMERRVYPKYQGAQQKRWMTENSSQGAAWPALNAAYADSKAKKYATMPGGGKKMMIATGRLFSGVTGLSLGKESGQHYKMITDFYMIVGTDLDYAPYAAAVRPFMNFKKEWIQELKDEYRDWVMKGGA